ncbi:hypothetical protein ACI6QG_05710 [Roseococcus sp. DSY-14]|uniref:hypothetical protein n=1 Tax=Roseococcus sp. DSY-14 TaxID=3369650 RepID=UPI00387B558C
MSDRPVGADQPRATINNVMEDARDLAGRAKAEGAAKLEEAKDKALALAGEAKAEGEDLLATARARAEDVAEQGKEKGAATVSALARAIHHIGEDLDQGAPEIGRHVHRAAEAADGLAHALRERPLGELVADVGDFARRNPTAFFAVSAIAGFALARFLKAGPAPRAMRHVRAGTGSYAGPAPRQPATMAAASLGGAAAYGGHPPANTMAQPVQPADMSHGGMGTRSGTVPNQHTGTPL